MDKNFKHGRPTIGVLAGWQFYRTATNLSYLAPVYRGIVKGASELDCNLLLGCGMGLSASPTDPMKAAWPVLLPDQDFLPIGEWNTDGLIIAVPLHSKAHSNYVQNLIKAQHPILFIGSGEAGPTIFVDNSGGVHDAMAHLFQHGHRDIAFIAGSQNDMQGDTGERLDSYRTFIEEHKLNQDPNLIAFGRHIYSGGFQAMQEIIASGCQFTAVMASNDESALGAMDALKASGFNVPEEVAVIGFDNRFEGAIEEPGLTSVHVPLYDIGYQSATLLIQKIVENTPLPETVKIETHLVIRQSCGCKAGKVLTDLKPAKEVPYNLGPAEKTAQVVDTISQMIIKEVQNFSKDEVFSLSKQLVEGFQAGIKTGDPSTFHQELQSLLEQTEKNGDIVYLWQKAINYLDSVYLTETTSPEIIIGQMLDEARKTINSHMQLQYRRHVMDERWVSSRLSLLTAELLAAIDEEQIFAILSKRLPEINIPIAKLAVFVENAEKSMAISTIRDVLDPAEEPIRFSSRNFPPIGYFDEKEPFLLTLIPILDQERQLGFMVFDAENLDLYGSIVQQVGSSLNTLRLYRQATEGRKLAEEANKLKSRFLSMISHELRTPLNLISGLSEIVLQDAEEETADIPSAIQKDILNIKAYAQHLNGLIGDVIDLATLDAGQLRLNKELIDLGDTLQMVVESGRHLAAEAGLEWQSNIPDTGPWVWGDRTRLRQVILNLISNAMKFTEKGEISLSLNEKDDQVVITVRDTGIGIPPEEQGEIFDAFRRSERSISYGLPGLGLGLTICKMIIEMHEGKIGLRSTGIDGQGSTFFVELPTIKLPSVKSEFVYEPLQESKRSVLLLTSRPGANTALFKTLRTRGITIYEEVMGESEIWQSRLSNISPEIVILDVTVQSDLTWRTLNAIKENDSTQDTPILLYASNEENESLLRLDYLTKPFEVEDLTKALDRHWDPERHEAKTHTILVVDDEPNTLDLYARIVKSQSTSNKILLANDGIQALEIIQKEPVDLVLLDLQMPKLDGFGVLKAMREDKRTRDIPVIVVTGLLLSEADIKRLNEGVAVILQKGLFNMDETADHIETTLEQKNKLSHETQTLIRQAMAYIHEHYHEPISREDIAQYVNISKDYLTYCFRQELKTTPIRYIQRYRVNIAKSLLKETDKSVTEIALAVGFSDSGYFSRIFSRELGISPDQYRRS